MFKSYTLNLTSGGLGVYPQQDSEWLYHPSVQSTRYLANRATLVVSSEFYYVKGQ